MAGIIYDRIINKAAERSIDNLIRIRYKQRLFNKFIVVLAELPILLAGHIVNKFRIKRFNLYTKLPDPVSSRYFITYHIARIERIRTRFDPEIYITNESDRTFLISNFDPKLINKNLPMHEEFYSKNCENFDLMTDSNYAMLFFPINRCIDDNISLSEESELFYNRPNYLPYFPNFDNKKYYKWFIENKTDLIGPDTPKNILTQIFNTRADWVPIFDMIIRAKDEIIKRITSSKPNEMTIRIETKSSIIKKIIENYVQNRNNR